MWPFILLVSLSPAVDTAPSPPYKRVATLAVYKEAYEPDSAVVGNRFFTGYRDSCHGYDLRTFKKVWSFKAGADASVERLAVSNGVVYATTSTFRSGNGHLLAINGTSGKLLWKLPRKGRGAAIAFRGNTIYTSLTPYELSAIDLRTRKVLWKRAVGKPSQQDIAQGELEALAVAGTKLLANVSATTICLDASSGKVLWREPNSYLFAKELPVAGGVVWVPSSEGSLARDLKSGKVLWKHATRGYGEYGGVFKGLFVGIDHGQLLALDPKTGQVKWSHTVGPQGTSGGYQYGSAFGDKLFVLGLSRTAVYGANGRELWSGASDEAIPQPVWTDGTHLVAFDHSRLIKYAHGAEAALPTSAAERQKLATEMVAKYDQLDSADAKRLVALGDDAFEPLLAEFVATTRKYDAVGEEGDSYPLYSRYHSLGELLGRVTSEKRESELLAALKAEKAKSAARPTLLQLLARFGKPENLVPFFLAELEGVQTPGFEMYESTTYVARQYIVNSSDPRAVAFMMKQLKDPEADPVLRYEAYVNLARTGGEEGLKAVLAARNKRRLLEPLAARVLADLRVGEERGPGPRLVHQKRDNSGRLWGLVESDAIGSRGDLWLVENVEGKWVRPYFSGVSRLRVSKWAKPAPPEPKIAGKTGAQLVEGAWFDTLVANAEIRKDSDSDALTDLVEKRLGTDPANGDTDGDGDGDEVDPWPNAAPRELTDEEKVFDAVFEARYHQGASGPALYFAEKGAKPFEMTGRMGPSIWAEDDERWSRPLEQCYEQGVAFIRFHGEERGSGSGGPIRWNAEKTEASVVISTYFGGLAGDGCQAIVRKFGDDWVVVAMRRLYVS